MWKVLYFGMFSCSGCFLRVINSSSRSLTATLMVISHTDLPALGLSFSFSVSLSSVLVSCYQFKFNLFRTDWILISSFLFFLQLLFQSSFLYGSVLCVTYFSLSLISASVLQSCFRPIKYILPVSFDTDNFFSYSLFMNSFFALVINSFVNILTSIKVLVFLTFSIFLKILMFLRLSITFLLLLIA